MASDGLNKKAKTGKCRMCLRRRCTTKYVEPVGEVHHGFATGFIWQCKDAAECEEIMNKKLADNPPGTFIHDIIKIQLEHGRFSHYFIRN